MPAWQSQRFAILVEFGMSRFGKIRVRPSLPWKWKLPFQFQPCSARSISAVLIVGKLGIVNASSLPHITDNRNFPVFGSGRGGSGNEAPIAALENSMVPRVARVG
jgi:hypothetical protein